DADLNGRPFAIQESREIKVLPQSKVRIRDPGASQRARRCIAKVKCVGLGVTSGVIPLVPIASARYVGGIATRNQIRPLSDVSVDGSTGIRAERPARLENGGAAE